MSAKSDERGRLAAGNRFAEITAIGALQALGLDGILLDLAGAKDVDANAARLADPSAAIAIEMESPSTSTRTVPAGFPTG